MLRSEFTNLAWDKCNGLLPAIVQHADSGEVLMLAYMTPETLAATLLQREAVFWSRSRGKTWRKGETSGNVLDVVDVSADCDGDTLLVLARPRGPTCHRPARSCFVDDDSDIPAFGGFLQQLAGIIDERISTADDESYSARLFAAGQKRMAQKLGEEAVEVALASVAGDSAEIVDESADLLFHLLILLRAHDLPLGRVVDELRRRHRSAAEAEASTS